MAVGSRVSPKRFSERKLVMMVVDLARTTSAVAGRDASEIAELLNTFFAHCGSAIESRDGRIVTFTGDGCLSVFDDGKGTDAIDAALDLREAIRDMCRVFDVDVELGVNIHQSIVAEGEFDPDGRYNVMGVGVIHTFRLGAGPGIRVTEPVYRQIPSSRRAPWAKNRPPAVYTLQDDAS